MKSLVRKWVPFVVSAGWVALIFMFSSQPYQKQSIQPVLHHSLTEQKAERVLPNVNFVYNDTDYSSRVDPYAVIEFLFRKTAHLFVYAMLALLAAAALGRWKKRRRWTTLPAALLLVLLVAALDEFNQRRIPGRTSNPEDVLVDLVGGCIGLLFYVFFSYLYKRSKSHKVKSS